MIKPELEYKFTMKNLPLVVSGDAARLRQVLLNLAGNAVKFTDHGGVAVEVENAGNTIRFWVRDTGPGIPAAPRGRFFRTAGTPRGSLPGGPWPR